MIGVTLKKGERLINALKRFRRKIEKAGIMDTYKENMEFTPNSVKKREEKKRGIKRERRRRKNEDF